MQISKLCLAFALALACVLPVAVRAADTEAQQKAREALEKKMQELGAAPAPSIPAPPAPASKAQPDPKPAAPQPALTAPPAADPAAVEKAREALRQRGETPAPPAVTPQPVVPAAPVTTAPQPEPLEPKPARVSPPPANATASMPQLVLPPSADPDAIEKARQALREKMNQVTGQPPVAPSPTVPAQPAPRTATVPAFATPPPAVAQPPPVAAQPGPPPPAVLNLPPAADPAVVEKAREAMRNKLQTLPPEQPAPPAVVARSAAPVKPAPPFRAATITPPAAEQRTPVKETRTAKTRPSYEPMAAPPLGIAATKQERLGELLRRYKADEITPQEYHAERAKILAAP